MDGRWVATAFGRGLEPLEFQEADAPPPRPGEVTIDVRAAGVNPVDRKVLDRNSDPALLPFPLGYELAGTIAAVGEDTEIASGGGAVGDEVLAFRVPGAYATRVTVPATDVFARPAGLPVDEAAGLLLVGTTAAEMLHRVGAEPGETILVHGASGAVGASLIQQAARVGVRVIGTASDRGAETVRRYGGIPTAYGPGLEERVRGLAPDGIAAALDAAGTDEAIEASLALVPDRDRILTIVRADAAEREGFRHIGGSNPDSALFRDAARSELIDLAARRELEVPIARTYPLSQAREALELVASGSAGGKVVLHT